MINSPWTRGQSLVLQIVWTCWLSLRCKCWCNHNMRNGRVGNWTLTVETLSNFVSCEAKPLVCILKVSGQNYCWGKSTENLYTTLLWYILKNKKMLSKCFMMKDINTKHLLDLKDTHDVFWWITLNVNFLCLQENSTGHL